MQKVLLALVILQISRSASAASFQIGDLEKLLLRNPQTGAPVDSIEELIPLLPNALKENFTFVYQSRSPFKDQISPLHPRVIMFNPDGRLVLTYIDSHQGSGSGILETISFSDREQRFHTAVHIMPEAQKRGACLTTEQSDCTRCHGVDSRPIYDSYPLWPGFYGSIRDTFPQRSHVGQEELANYRRFLATSAHSGVYKDLHFPSASPVSPYLDPALFKEDRDEGELSYFKFLPNTRLGMALTELNRKRLARILFAQPSFQDGAERSLRGLLECPQSQLTTAADEREVQTQLLEENRQRLQRLGVIDPGDYVVNMEELKFVHALAQIENLAARAHISTREWSMALEPESLAFFDGILTGIDRGENFYLKEDMIFEMLNRIRHGSAFFSQFFLPTLAYPGTNYPFGHRLQLSRARKLCTVPEARSSSWPAAAAPPESVSKF